MLGGGTFTSQNKSLPGAYINVISATKSTAEISDRGVAAIPVELDWGQENQVVTVTADEFYKKSLTLFGYAYDTAQMRNLREVFCHANKVHIYRLGTHTKAKNTFAEAKYGGVRGNDISIIISANVDNPELFDVSTALSGSIKDTQTVSKSSELVDNDWVKFNNAQLTVTAGTALTGGTNGEISGEDYQNFINDIESYSFNTLGCASTEKTVKGLIAAFTKRMREELGVKFQTVLYDYAQADYYGVISVKNKAETSGAKEGDTVYWVTGAQAGCSVNKSVTNMKYDGELDINVSYTQTQLAELLESGNLMFHRSGGEIRVLDDVNTLVTTADEIGDDFKSNQTIRVLDQIANDVATLFNTKYLGQVQNDQFGRIAFKNDVIKIHTKLANLSAIENFESDDITAGIGDTKKSVTASTSVQPVNAMSKLYMTVVCR